MKKKLKVMIKICIHLVDKIKIKNLKPITI